MWSWAARRCPRAHRDQPAALRAGISLEDVRTALQSASANRPRGALEGIDIAKGGWPGRSIPTRPR
jgi:hypothetical protein